MRQHENATASTALMLELASSITKNLPKDMPHAIAKEWVENPSALAIVIRGVLMPAQQNGSGVETRGSQILGDWEVFYRDVFGLSVGEEFCNMEILAHRPGFDRAIVIPKGLTIDQVYAKCAEMFPSWKYINGSLDQAVPTNDRDPKNGSYAIWVRDRVEADDELKSKSANDLKSAGVPGITLLERLLLELKYFKETGKHLDVKYLTLCTGSRGSDGYVPSVYWYGGGLGVRWIYPIDSDSDWRSREVVS